MAVQQVATPGQVTAALIAALVAVALGIANIVVTLYQAHETRKAARNLADREQWWDRFTWGAESLVSENEELGVIAASVLNSLAAVECVQDDDKAMILRLFDELNDDIDISDLEGAADGQDQ